MSARITKRDGADRRGMCEPVDHDPWISPTGAGRALAEHPEVLTRCRSLFPFFVLTESA
jgi:hypothetical protein